MAINYEEGSGIVNAFEAGRQAARQREEDAYVKARRPIENAFADRKSELGIQSAEQGIANAASAEERAASQFKRTEQSAVDAETYAAAALLTDTLARQIEANPGVKPSELLARAPDVVKRRAGLGTPEAVAHFAQIYDANPGQLRMDARMYGAGGKKVSKQEAATNADGDPGFLITFEDGETQFVPGYKETPKASTNPIVAASSLGKYFDKATQQWLDIPGAAEGAAGVAGGRTLGTEGAKETVAAPAKAQALEVMKADIADMRALLDTGAAKKAFTSTKQGIADNIGAAIATSGLPGVAEAQRAFAPETQTIRDELKAIVPRIANKIMQASNMGVRMLDTEKEYERFIAQINNPSATVESQRSALDRLERAMVRDVQVSSEPTLSLKGKKLVYNPETGELE